MNIGRSGFKEADNIKKIEELIKKAYKDIPISYHDISGQEQETCLGKMCIDNGVKIYINAALKGTNLMEAVLVHEGLHAILRTEAFPSVVRDETNYLWHICEYTDELNYNSFIQSKIEHPEIYRRMRKSFKLDMSEYFKLQVEKIYCSYLRRNSPKENENPNPYAKCFAVLMGLESSFFDQPYRDEAYEMIENYYHPGITQCSKKIYNCIKDDYSSPDAVRKIFEVSKDTMSSFEDDPDFRNTARKFWSCFKLTYVDSNSQAP